jgi:hypothetical protein
MSTALKKINARVKALAKKHPGSKRVTLQKQAGREYRAGKLGGARKKKVGKVKRRSVVGKKKVGKVKRRSRVGAARRGPSNGADRFDNKRTTITVGSISSQTSKLKAQIAERIGWLEAMKMSATTAKSYNGYQKKISELKAKYRRLE